MVWNDQKKILWNFQIQMDKLMMTNQPDIVILDKQRRKAVVTEVATSSDSSIKKKEHEKLGKYQGLREALKSTWKVKARVAKQTRVKSKPLYTKNPAV